MPYSQEQLKNRKAFVDGFNRWVQDVYALNRKAQPPRKEQVEKLIDYIKAISEQPYQLDDCAVDLNHETFKNDLDALIKQTENVQKTKSGKSVTTLMYKVKSGIEAKDITQSLDELQKLLYEGTVLNKARQHQKGEIIQLLEDTVDEKSRGILLNILGEPFQSDTFGRINEIVAQNINFNVSPESFNKKIDVVKLDEEYFSDDPRMRGEPKQHQVDSQQLVTDALIAMKSQLHQYVTEHGDDLFSMDFNDIDKCYATLNFCTCLKKFLELNAFNKNGEALGADDVMPQTAEWLVDNLDIHNLTCMANLKKLPELLGQADKFLRGEGTMPKAGENEIGQISYDITNMTSAFIVALEQSIFNQLDKLDPEACSKDLKDLLDRKKESHYTLTSEDLGVIHGEFMTDKTHEDLKQLSESLLQIQSMMGMGETPNFSPG